MDVDIRARLEIMRGAEGDARYAIYNELMQATESPVDWAYEVWDVLLADLSHPDAHVRSTSAQMLCNLAKSDPKKRMLQDFDAVLAVTRDEKFVTARHTLQSVWKVGLVGPKHRQLVLDRLIGRFADSASEKNCTLIRHDIVVGLKQLFDGTADATIQAAALALIETEKDDKYRKKYAAAWRKV